MTKIKLKTKDDIVVTLSLIPFIPQFIESKIIDVYSMASLIEQHQFDEVENIGHKWSGSCKSFGFNYLGDIGLRIEKLSQVKSSFELEVIIKSLIQYLKNLTIRPEK